MLKISRRKRQLARNSKNDSCDRQEVEDYVELRMSEFRNDEKMDEIEGKRLQTERLTKYVTDQSAAWDF